MEVTRTLEYNSTSLPRRVGITKFYIPLYKGERVRECQHLTVSPLSEPGRRTQ